MGKGRILENESENWYEKALENEMVRGRKMTALAGHYHENETVPFPVCWSSSGNENVKLEQMQTHWHC